MYKLQVQCYRWMKKLFWTDLNIDILKLTKHSEDNTIKVRWQVRGLPKYNIPFMLMSRGFGERQQWYRLVKSLKSQFTRSNFCIQFFFGSLLYQQLDV